MTFPTKTLVTSLLNVHVHSVLQLMTLNEHCASAVFPSDTDAVVL
jgi:hypothetical protein